MKSLKTIQTFAKIGKVLSTIIFILSIVGAALCAVAIISYAVIGNGAIKLGGVTLHSIIEKETKITDAGLYTILAAGVIACVAEIFIAARAKKYFTNELREGTPFTLPLAKEMRSFGLFDLIVSLVTAFVCSTGIAIMEKYAPELKQTGHLAFGSVGIAIAFIVVSFICEYGAEVKGEQ